MKAAASVSFTEDSGDGDEAVVSAGPANDAGSAALANDAAEVAAGRAVALVLLVGDFC